MEEIQVVEDDVIEFDSSEDVEAGDVEATSNVANVALIANVVVI